MPVVPPTAALAGVPAGVQANGLWIGRRQLFVRFAAEAETATMYTPDALNGELKRLVARSAYHSISVSGRDPLANAGFLRAALEKSVPAIPVMLDCDGQRPEAIGEVARFLKLVQVTLDGAPADSLMERAMATSEVGRRCFGAACPGAGAGGEHDRRPDSARGHAGASGERHHGCGSASAGRNDQPGPSMADVHGAGGRDTRRHSPYPPAFASHGNAVG